MTSLAVFDFDRTIVSDDSDATIIKKLKEIATPPQWEGRTEWTPYMNDVFERAFTAGLSESDILDSIASMRPTPGVVELISTLAAEGWDVIIVSDANSVFVNHWLKTHDLQHALTSVITNPASFHDGCLLVEPCMSQTSCPRCPRNLCKSLALEQLAHGRVVYTGDGSNDYCPVTRLGANATVFPRKGYPLEGLINNTLATSTPEVTAKVVPWTDCYTILQELFPGKSANICLKK